MANRNKILIVSLSLMIVGSLLLGSFMSVSREAPANNEPARASIVMPYNWTGTFPNTNIATLWLSKNASDPGFPYPYASPDVGKGAAFFGTKTVLVPFWGIATGWTLTALNTTALFPLDTKIVVGLEKDWNTTALQLANAARWNPRIVGALYDDFAVGAESPANMSRPYALLHSQDANLTQGPLKLYIVVYVKNYFMDSPHNWTSIAPYFDGIEYWYFGGKYGFEGQAMMGYEDGGRWLHAQLPTKLIKGGVYLHYYNAGYYQYSISSDVLKADARLMKDGAMTGISILADFWIANNPETAYMVRNFLYNEMSPSWTSTWAWSTDAVTTYKNGVAVSQYMNGVQAIKLKWAGNKTFTSAHSQNVSVTGFSGLNLTVKDLRTAEYVRTLKIGSTWYFIASAGESYQAFNWPHTSTTFTTNQSISAATSWNNRDIIFKDSALFVNSSFWLNNSRIRFENSLFVNDAWIGQPPTYGIWFNSGNNPKAHLNNDSFEPYQRYFSYRLNDNSSGTSKVLDLRNSSFVGYSGYLFAMGDTTISDCIFFGLAPDGSTDYSVKVYVPGFVNSLVFTRNLVWNYQCQSNAQAGGIFMPGALNGTGSQFTDNKFFGGFVYGFLADSSFSNEYTFNNTLIAKSDVYHPTWAWTTFSGGDPANSQWLRTKVSLKTDIAITGTLSNATGATIGTYSSVNGYLNATGIPWANYRPSNTVIYRNPYPYKFHITSALPAGYYYMLVDTSTLNQNKSVWAFPGSRDLNGTTFTIWQEEAQSLYLMKVPLALWAGTTNYVNASKTLSFPDRDTYWSKYNWTAPTLTAGVSASTNKGTLAIWGISYTPSSQATVASWYALHNQTGGTMAMSFSGLIPNQKYAVYRDGVTVMAYVKADSSGHVNYTYSGAWSAHRFDMAFFTEGGAAGLRAAFVFTVSGLRVSFQDASQGHGIYQWAWDFGDGTTSTTQDPTHSYKAAGSYRVTLTVMNADGLSDTTSKTISVSGSAATGGGALLNVSIAQVLAFGLLFAAFVIILAVRRPSGIIIAIIAALIGIYLLVSSL